MNRQELKVATPCTLDWKKMTPAEGGRFCGDCKKVVRDLSSMTEREARALLKREAGGELCVRFLLDKHGRVFFGGDAPRRSPTLAQQLLPAGLLSRAKRATAVAAALALPFATGACEAITEPLGITSQEQTADHHDLEPTMGAIAYDPHTDQPDADADADASADAGDGGDASDAGDAADGSTEEDAATDGGAPIN